MSLIFDRNDSQEWEMLYYVGGFDKVKTMKVILETLGNEEQQHVLGGAIYYANTENIKYLIENGVRMEADDMEQHVDQLFALTTFYNPVQGQKHADELYIYLCKVLLEIEFDVD